MKKFLWRVISFPYRISYGAAGLLSRKGIDAFIESNLPISPDRQILNVGCGGRVYRPASEVRVDVAVRSSVDVVADAHRLPFREETFPTCLLVEVLEHLSNPDEAVQEIHRVTAPGGKLILTTRFIFPLHSVPHDYFRYTEFGLRHLLRNWTDVKLRAQHDWYSTFLVLFVRNFSEESPIAKVFFPVVVVITYAFWLLRPIFSKIPLNYITSGYFVVATK